MVLNTCSVTFAPASIVDKASSKAVKVRVNSSSFTNGANTSDAMSVTINATTDFETADGTSIEIPLESVVAPFTVANVSYE